MSTADLETKQREQRLNGEPAFQRTDENPGRLKRVLGVSAIDDSGNRDRHSELSSITQAEIDGLAGHLHPTANTLRRASGDLAATDSVHCSLESVRSDLSLPHQPPQPDHNSLSAMTTPKASTLSLSSSKRNLWRSKDFQSYVLGTDASSSLAEEKAMVELVPLRGGTESSSSLVSARGMLFRKPESDEPDSGAKTGVVRAVSTSTANSKGPRHSSVSVRRHRSLSGTGNELNNVPKKGANALSGAQNSEVPAPRTDRGGIDRPHPSLTPKPPSTQRPSLQPNFRRSNSPWRGDEKTPDKVKNIVSQAGLADNLSAEVATVLSKQPRNPPPEIEARIRRLELDRARLCRESRAEPPFRGWSIVERRSLSTADSDLEFNFTQNAFRNHTRLSVTDSSWFHQPPAPTTTSVTASQHQQLLQQLHNGTGLRPANQTEAALRNGGNCERFSTDEAESSSSNLSQSNSDSNTGSRDDLEFDSKGIENSEENSEQEDRAKGDESAKETGTGESDGDEASESQMADEASRLLTAALEIDASLSPSARARHRWCFVLSYVLKLVQATSLFRMPAMQLSAQRRSSMLQSLRHGHQSEVDPQGLTYLLKAHQTKADLVFSAKVQAMLEGERTAEILSTLEKLLGIRMKCFSNYSQDQMRELCASMQYESRPSGAIIVKEGHDPLNFYFILSGQCEIFQTKGGINYRINIINMGDSFGELPSEGKRTILHMTDAENVGTRIAALTGIPHFQLAHASVIERAAQCTQLHTFQPQEPIVQEGLENFSIFWIVRGACRAVKVVPFVKRRTTPESAVHRRRFHVEGYEAGKTVLGEGDVVAMQVVKVRELGPGDHFPEMVAVMSAEKFNRIELMAKLSSDDPNRIDARSYVSVIATTKVEVVSMTRVDYARVASNEMILKMMADRDLLRVPVDLLQQAIIEKRNWDAFKQGVVDSVIKAKHEKTRI
ncbi:hypothetical protein DFJ73DRAFT_756231 [Zopfochytrium polystomum]|nr:hypothetical protein DFJ73DRAFT_756231 [Zopfochytrium polystomum]